jgi:fructoselysine 6-phosphate deglycase/fructoselysine-6-phosphate deglycase
VVASTLLGRLAEHFEAWTGHALSDRRYMWKVEY